MSKLALHAATILGALSISFGVSAQQAKDPSIVEIEKYRAMLAEGNPAELYELRGEGLWKGKRGAKNASLEQCDLGAGPGVVKGAYAQMPRYFADVGKVQDLESRIATCMMTLQGFSDEQIRKTPFGSEASKSDMEALVAYVVGQSRDMKMNVPLKHPQEKATYEIGKKIFFYRAGPYDFSCASCHSEEGKRIRLQDLPDLTKPKGAQLAYTTWPAYRVSQGELRTMQWRLWDCFRQQRFPEPQYLSDTLTALTSYLAVSANGGVYAGPGIKR